MEFHCIFKHHVSFFFFLEERGYIISTSAYFQSLILPEVFCTANVHVVLPAYILFMFYITSCCTWLWERDRLLSWTRDCVHLHCLRRGFIILIYFSAPQSMIILYHKKKSHCCKLLPRLLSLISDALLNSSTKAKPGDQYLQQLHVVLRLSK